MGEIAVIELGEIPSDPVVDDPPTRPWPQRRWVLVALALGLALATVGGSVPPRRPLPVAVLPARTGSTVALAGELIFVVDPDRSVDDRHVAAYRTTDLTPVWRVRLPVDGEAHWLTAVDGTVVLSAGQPADAGLGLTTVALDAATGMVRWRHQAAFDGQTPGGLVLLSSEQPGAAPDDAEPDATGQTLRAVHVDSGDVVWSLNLPAGHPRSYRFAGENVDLLAVVSPTGRVDVRDVDTGKLVRSRQIDSASGVDGPGRFAAVFGDLLLVPEASWIVAYGLDRLDVRWRLPFQVGRDGWPVGCGNDVCFLRENGGLTVVDRATGRREWSDARWSTILSATERYLIVSDSRRHEQRVAAVDPDTGQVRREFGSGQEVHPSATGDLIIGIRYELARAVVAQLDPQRGTRILGVLHNILNSSCWTQQSRLLCWRTDNTLGIWRLPA